MLSVGAWVVWVWVWENEKKEKTSLLLSKVFVSRIYSDNMSYNISDALTKSLPGPVLTQHREVMLGHTPFYARLLH